MANIDKLNSLQLDALTELSNIGAGNAATSLSQMLGRRIDMAVPRANIAPFAGIVEIVGGADVEVAGGYMRVDHDMPMGILFLIPKDKVFYLLDLLFGLPSGTTGSWEEMQQSAFTGKNYYPSVPAMAVDMAGAILGEALEHIGEVSDFALVLENIFIENERQIKGYFFLLPEPQTLDSLLKALGVL